MEWRWKGSKSGCKGRVFVTGVECILPIICLSKKKLQHFDGWCIYNQV